MNDEQWKAITVQKVEALESRVGTLERVVREMKMVVDLLHAQQR